MRQLLPAPVDDVDALDVYLSDRREPHRERPWVMLNMIASVDGATAVDGRSGGLGGPADNAVFRAVRASCDWILVASGTARAERYRAPDPDPEVVERRLAQGRSATPRLAIVTASGRLDPTIPALASRDTDGPAPLVITGADGDRAALAGLDAEIAVVPESTPTPVAVLRELHDRGAAVVLAEGGPTWNGHLSAAGVIDEVCVSVSPTLVGGDSARIVGGEGATPTPLQLDRLLVQDGYLFARYLRA